MDDPRRTGADDLYAAVQADGRNVLADSDLIASTTPDPAMEERGTLLPVEWTGRETHRA